MRKPTSKGPDGGYVLEDQVGFKMRLAYQKHSEIFSLLLPDLTPTQFAVLWKLHDRGTLSQNELGRLIAMDGATVKGVIDRLKKRDLVTTAPSNADLRRLDVSLTAAGRARIADAVPLALNISKLTVQRLTAREESQLLSLLDKLT